MRSAIYKLLPVLIITAVAVSLHATSYADVLFDELSGQVARLTGQRAIRSEILTEAPSSLQHSLELWENQSPVKTDFDETRFDRLLQVHESGGHLKTADMVFMIEASQQKYILALKKSRDSEYQRYSQRAKERQRRKHPRWRRNRRLQAAG